MPKLEAPDGPRHFLSRSPPPAADRDARTVRNVQSTQVPDGGALPGAGPLLRAIALQRPIDNLVELLTFLAEEEQSAHAQQLLVTAATLRPVGDVAALVPRLCGPQAATTLHAAAAYRPMEELAQLVRHLHNPPGSRPGRPGRVPTGALGTAPVAGRSRPRPPRRGPGRAPRLRARAPVARTCQSIRPSGARMRSGVPARAVRWVARRCRRGPDREVGAEVADASVTEQEIVAHVFVRPDGPDGEATDRRVRGIWDRFVDLCVSAEPVGASWAPAAVPPQLAVNAGSAAGSSLVLAAVQDQGRSIQALLRQEQGRIVLSLLLTERAGEGWIDLDRQLDRILGSEPLAPLPGSGLFGTAVLYLGKTDSDPALRPWNHGGDVSTLPESVGELLPRLARGTPGGCRVGRTANGITVWVTAPRLHGLGPERRFVLLAEPERDRELEAWVWSESGSATLPPFVRHLLHTAEVRDQLRLETGVSGGPGPVRTKAISHVLGAWSRAAGAVDGQFVEPVHAAPFDEDCTVAARLVRVLDGEQPRPPERASVPAPRLPSEPAAPLRVLALADEWYPKSGGLSTLNRHLCAALAAAGAQVFAMVPAPTEAERADAAALNVGLAGVRAHSGGPQRDALFRRPELPEGVVPDIVIGHGRVTGPAARVQTEDHFPGAARFHFVHVEPDHLEWHKPGRSDDTGSRAEERTGIELDLGRGAAGVVAVGPRLYEWLERDLPVLDGMPPLLRFDPGFDPGANPGLDLRAAEPRTPPRGVPQILALGRMEDASVKGLDIAARAIGAAVRWSPADTRWEFLVRGAPVGETEALRGRVRGWIGDPRVSVVVRPYSDQTGAVARDVRRASLVLMPSRAEAFGLVGLEAVVAGAPVLASAGSGLGMLMREVLPREQAGRVVLPVDDTLEQDTAVWGAAVAAALRNREAAFADAEAVRRLMARERTWAMAVNQILAAVPSGHPRRRC